jgi:NADPH2:quinone reductase
MIAYGHPGPRALSDVDAIVRFDAPPPEIGEADILVRVSYVGLNSLDAKLRATAKATADRPRILGFEGAGRIEAIGRAVSGFAVGDRVAWLGQIDRQGATAELASVDYRLAAQVPPCLSLEDAAATPMAFITAYGLLAKQMGLSRDQEGELLIVNGAGGVGSAAIQLARKLTAMTVVATASRTETRDWCRALGAHDVVSHSGDIAVNLKDAGYHVVAAIASLTNTQDNFTGLLKRLAPHGIIGVIDQPTLINAALLRPKAQRLAFEGAFVPSLMQPGAMPGQAAVLKMVLDWMSDGTLQSIRHGEITDISCDNLLQAHQKLEARLSIGKSVLRVCDESVDGVDAPSRRHQKSP